MHRLRPLFRLGVHNKSGLLRLTDPHLELEQWPLLLRVQVRLKGALLLLLAVLNVLPVAGHPNFSRLLVDRLCGCGQGLGTESALGHLDLTQGFAHPDQTLVALQLGQ